MLIFPPLSPLNDIKNPYSYLLFSKEQVLVPYSLLSIASYCSKKGNYEFSILNLSLEYSKLADQQIADFDYETFLFEILKKSILDFKPDLVGISSLADHSLIHIELISSKIKKISSSIVIVAGGNPVTNHPKETLNTDVDGIALGSGEEPMLHLLESKDYISFLNKSDEWITKNSFAKSYNKNLFTKLDEIYPMHWDLLDLSEYIRLFPRTRGIFLKEGKKGINIFSSRGCPFLCTFCSSHSVHGRKVYNISLEPFLNEIEFLHKTHGIEYFSIDDDIFNADKKRLIKLLRSVRKISPSIEIECPSGFAISLMDEEMISVLKETGFKWVQIAIESGNQETLKSIRKPLKLEKAVDIINLLQKYEIYTRAFFILGIPGETKEQMKNTIDFMLCNRINWCSISLAKPLGGSEMYATCLENNYLKNNAVGYLSENRACINTLDFTSDEVDGIVYDANILVNFVNNYDLFRGGRPENAIIGFDNVLGFVPTHPFALFYKTLALKRLGYAGKAKECLEKFDNVIEEKSVWDDLVRKYGLREKRKEL